MSAVTRRARPAMVKLVINMLVLAWVIWRVITDATMVESLHDITWDVWAALAGAVYVMLTGFLAPFLRAVLVVMLSRSE